MAEGIRDAYQDLFKVNTKANELSKQELINKMKTLSQGQLSEAVLDKMSMTFVALVKNADFQSPTVSQSQEPPKEKYQVEQSNISKSSYEKALNLGGLVYNIQIVLPESRDSAVYDALFSSLRKHLD